MSQIYVAEYPGLAQTDQGDSVDLLPMPPTTEYNIIVSAGSSGGPTFQQSTKFIEISTDTTCSIVIGPSPGTIGTGSASVTNLRMNANERIRRRVPYFPPQTAPQGGPTNQTRYSVFTTANV